MKHRAPFNPAAESDTAIARSFRALADIGFQVVQPREQIKRARRKPVPGIAVSAFPDSAIVIPTVSIARPRPRRIVIPQILVPLSAHNALRIMALEAVWTEEGGRAVGAMNAWEEKRFGIKTREEMNAQGMGRTRWIGMPQWARGWNMNRAEITATVEKAIRGDSLGKRQRLLIEVMLEEINGPDDQPDDWAGIGELVGHSDQCPF